MELPWKTRAESSLGRLSCSSLARLRAGVLIIVLAESFLGKLSCSSLVRLRALVLIVVLAPLEAMAIADWLDWLEGLLPLPLLDFQLGAGGGFNQLLADECHAGIGRLGVGTLGASAVSWTVPVTAPLENMSPLLILTVTSPDRSPSLAGASS